METKLKQLLQDVNTVGREVRWLECIDSTNLECRRLAAEGAAEGLAILAREQTAGRGRRGRSFQSSKDIGLYLSVLLRPTEMTRELSNLTAWVAVAVCRAVKQACGVEPGIKWINDLILNGKKLGGILVELGLEPGTGKLDHLVVGIGLNVRHKREDFDPELRDMATSLELELGRGVDLPELAACLIRELDRMWNDFPAGKMAYLEEYRRACITTGQPVQLITPASREEARSLEIDEDFHLVVELPDGEIRKVSAGEVSVRGMYGYV